MDVPVENKLALVSIDDLLTEAESRCESFVVAYLLKNEDDTPVKTRYGRGEWFKAISCAAILQNDCINNWNNELEALQKLSEDMKEE
jgi:hypothetical protein